MISQKDLRTIRKLVQNLQNGQMADICEILDQF